MRLITHNMLISNIKGVENGFPLRIQAENVEIRESEFDAEFISNMLKKIDYAVLLEGAVALGYEELPPVSEVTAGSSQKGAESSVDSSSSSSNASDEAAASAGGSGEGAGEGAGGGGSVAGSVVVGALATDEAFLRKVHHALLDLHLLDGQLICPETGRPFPVKDGIPNMLLHEDEV